MNKVRPPSDLPEHLAHLYKPQYNRFKTPLDTRGIADADAVFELAAWTFPGNLAQALRSYRDIHHLYRTEDNWIRFARSQKTQADSNTIYNFRNGTPQKMYVPRLIHEWIEQSQLPPPAPPLETMRRCNTAWASASLLLRSCIELDKARQDYSEKKGKTRRLLGNIPGITPPHRRFEEEYIYVVDDEYWLSELNKQLEGWQYIAATRGDLAVQEGILETPRLSDVRRLYRRIRPGAIVPKTPEFIEAA